MKIGFIAMSGVRAHNEELTELGLTLPGFVERNKVIASLPSLSLLTLAALTPPKFEVEYREVADLKAADLLPDDYDLVAISTFSAQIFEAYSIADTYRQKGIPVVMGGLHVTSLPEEAKAHCTSVVVGEGEPLWPQVLADFERHDLQPYYIQDPRGTYDLADAPIPRFDLLEHSKYNRLTVQTSRGCPHLCDFCASSILLTPRYKVKPIPNVIAEIRAIKSFWSHPFIEFADDNMFINRPHSRNLLRALTQEKIHWFTETDISVADDEHTLALMRDSGCRMILVGLESPRRASLAGIELHADWKMKQQVRYLEALDRIHSYGVCVIGCFVLGLDGDTPEIFDEVLDFTREANLFDVQITFMTAFPGTPLYERLKREGRLIKDRAWDLCTLFDPNITPRGMTLQQLQDGFLRLGKVLYSEEEMDARRHRFHAVEKAGRARHQASAHS
ncbi:MAG: B12-binding domain-containing radical SAM protein [bacterium]